MSHFVNFACWFASCGCFTAFCFASVHFKQFCFPTDLYFDGEPNVSFCCSFVCSLYFSESLAEALLCVYLTIFLSCFNYLTFDCKNYTTFFKSWFDISLFLCVTNNLFLWFIYMGSSFCNQNDFLLITYVFRFCETHLLCVFCVGLCLCSVLLSFFLFLCRLEAFPFCQLSTR